MILVTNDHRTTVRKRGNDQKNAFDSHEAITNGLYTNLNSTAHKLPSLMCSKKKKKHNDEKQ